MLRANVLSEESSNSSPQPQIIDTATKEVAAIFAAPRAGHNSESSTPEESQLKNAIELVLLIQKLCSKEKKMEHDTEGHPLGAILASKEELAELCRELKRAISHELGQVAERFGSHYRNEPIINGELRDMNTDKQFFGQGTTTIRFQNWCKCVTGLGSRDPI
ncbi:hypothetical protein N7540_010563 [Penicillium herquei]|nr:hypothetical protein N7540_010563 [Penicillium herquei]